MRQVDKRNHVRTTCRCLVMAQLVEKKNLRPYGRNISDFVSIKGSLSDTPVAMWLILAPHQEFNGNICSEDRTRGRPSSVLQFYLFPGINISLIYSISEINPPVVWCSHCQEVITDPCTFHATATFFDCLMCCCFSFFLFFKRIIRLQPITSASCWNYFLAVRRQMEMFGYKLSLFSLLHNKSRADTCLRGSVRILKVLFWSSSSEKLGRGDLIGRSLDF